jgi:putative peptide zinc metalloprotease protein
MLVELLVAAIAMQVWLSVQPGAVRAVAFNTMLIAGVSTVFFNGNPLLRYDAYYMLMDWLEMPNLASRSNRYLGYLVERYAFGLDGVKSPLTARGEAPWFVFYAVASFFYRMLVMVVIALFIASQYFVVGLVLALWALTATVLWPLVKKIGYLFTAERLAGQRGRALAAAAAATAAVILLLGVVPVPYRTLAQGVVTTPEESWVRAAVAGVIVEVLVPSNARVAAGMPLVRLADPVLSVRVKVLEAQLAEVEARYDAALTTDRVAAATLRAEQRLAQERLDAAAADERELVVLSPVDGVFLLPRPAADMPGAFVQRGDTWLCCGSGHAMVRVVVPKEASPVRERTTAVAVRFAESLERSARRRVVRSPAATSDLPSSALSLAGGGGFATDPRAANAETAFASLFRFDLELGAETAGAPRLGGRAYVRFDHGVAPLASQWYLRLRQLLLERLDV